MRTFIFRTEWIDLMENLSQREFIDMVYYMVYYTEMGTDPREAYEWDGLSRNFKKAWIKIKRSMDYAYNNYLLRIEESQDGD